MAAGLQERRQATRPPPSSSVATLRATTVEQIARILQNARAEAERRKSEARGLSREQLLKLCAEQIHKEERTRAKRKIRKLIAQGSKNENGELDGASQSQPKKVKKEEK